MNVLRLLASSSSTSSSGASATKICMKNYQSARNSICTTISAANQIHTFTSTTSTTAHTESGRTTSIGLFYSTPSPHTLQKDTQFRFISLSSSCYCSSKQQMNSTTEPSSTAKSNSKGSLTKKLLVLWTATAATIGLVLLVDYNIYGKNVDTAEIVKKRERAKGQTAFGYILGMPCMRNSILLAIVSGFGSWVVTFLLTSNPNKAYRVGLITPAIVFTTYLSYCTYVTSKAREEADKITAVLKDVQKNK